MLASIRDPDRETSIASAAPCTAEDLHRYNTILKDIPMNGVHSPVTRPSRLLMLCFEGGKYDLPQYIAVFGE